MNTKNQHELFVIPGGKADTPWTIESLKPYEFMAVGIGAEQTVTQLLKEYPYITYPDRGRLKEYFEAVILQNDIGLDMYSKYTVLREE